MPKISAKFRWNDLQRGHQMQVVLVKIGGFDQYIAISKKWFMTGT